MQQFRLSQMKNSTEKKSEVTMKRKSATESITLEGLKEGDKLPNLLLPATGGKTIALEGLRGKIVVLFFYPKDATPGCTQEGHEFTALHADFKKAGAEVFGVSRDSVKSHDKFKEKEGYSVDLLSDENESLCGAFGVVKMKNMYGKQVRGIERSTFVVNAKGQVVKSWRKVSVPGHAQEVLDFIKQL